MCGISIIYNIDRQKPQHDRLLRMNQALRHRGPDAEGVYIQDGAGLGHTRLSIVDVGSGKQPMTSADGKLTIVYNGELYNYRALQIQLKKQGVVFNTDSDTEVVLYLFEQYGHACVNHMRGMFSFAVHNSKSDELFIARDRLGIKPLFYHWDGKSLIAASEIKAIFASGYVEPRLCLASIKNYFTYQFSVSPHTPFESIYELPPGYCMNISHGGKPNLVRYWDLEFPMQGEYESIDEKYWLNEFSVALTDAVGSHTIGDVPIGSYLSGGIDSCAITQLLAATSRDTVQTFSIGFSDPNHDESSLYKQIASHLVVDNKELRVTDEKKSDYLQILSDCLYHLEQPQRMSVDIPHFLLSKFVKKHQFKAVCTGDGADEILAGYDCFRQDSMRVNSNGLFSSLFRKKSYLGKYTQYFSDEHMRMLLWLHSRRKQKQTIDRFGFYPAWYDFWQINAELTDDLFLSDVPQDSAQNNQMAELLEHIQPNIAKRHPLNQSLFFETRTRLPGWILWKSDRLSMANGVEARVPFMDHPLVELAARLPPQLKLNGMNEKYILKTMMADRLPKMSHGFKKRGFYTPIREWFFTRDRYASIAPYLSKESLQKSGIFNADVVIDMHKQILEMPAPQDMNAYYVCMRLEWILLTVLSVQILHHLFVNKNASCFQDSLADDVRVAELVT